MDLARNIQNFNRLDKQGDLWISKVPTYDECHNCDRRFDDLTDTVFAGHHQPLKVWILCLYFMGLNLSNEQIAHELSINESDAYQMMTELRGGIVKKSRQ
jgi:transposase-like protein